MSDDLDAQRSARRRRLGRERRDRGRTTMRFLHRHCVPRVRLEAEQIELAEQRYAHQEALRSCGRDNALLESKLAGAREVARSFERDADQLTKERDEALAELATCQSDLRTARPLTRGEVERVVRENPTDDGALVEAILEVQRNAVTAPREAVEAAQTAIETATEPLFCRNCGSRHWSDDDNTCCERLAADVEAATEGVTQEVGE